MKKPVITIFALIIIFSAVFTAVYITAKKDNASEIVRESEEKLISAEEQRADEIDKILNSMTLEEKINQLFIITPEALTGIGQATAAGDTTKTALAEHPAGGIIYFTQNFIDEGQTKEMIKNTKSFAKEVCKLPLFIAVDEEGGTVARLGNSEGINVPDVGNMADIGKGKDINKAYETGCTIGDYLSDYGFNLDFAPVADAYTNPENEIVRLRSFSSDPELAGNMAAELSRGLNDKGIFSCYKHFPGHGATKGDTHEGFAYTDKTYEEIENSDLIPFVKAIENNAGFIMVGHISLPDITGDNTPASISPVIINDILKTKLGYKGIVITDALNMGALTSLYKSDETAVKALEAGADMLLMPEDFKLAYEGIVNAVNSGTLTEERINESVRKIIDKKLDINQIDG